MQDILNILASSGLMGIVLAVMTLIAIYFILERKSTYAKESLDLKAFSDTFAGYIQQAQGARTAADREQAYENARQFCLNERGETDRKGNVRAKGAVAEVFQRALEHFEQYHHYRTLAETTRHYEQIQVVYRLSNAIRVQQATSQLHQENMALQEVVASLHALHKQVRESAQRDSLTQLYNRRYLEEQLPRLLAEFQRGGAPLSAAMLDMDDFKRINDTFRHTMGDTVLQRIAEVVQTALAPGDIAVRYGGDELLVLMPDTPIPQAQTRVEAIRQAIQTHDWSVLAPGLTVTLSAGVATARASDEGMSLVERADANLLAAKRRGKNRLMGAAAR